MDETQKEKIKEQELKEKEPKLHITTIRKIMKINGINMISNDALEEVRMILQDILRDMSRNIVIFTQHRGRKISNKDDVLLSVR